MGIEASDKLEKKKRGGLAKALALGASLLGASAGEAAEKSRPELTFGERARGIDFHETHGSLPKSRYEYLPKSKRVIDITESDSGTNRAELTKLIRDVDEQSSKKKVRLRNHKQQTKFGPYDKDIEDAARRIRGDVRKGRPDKI